MQKERILPEHIFVLPFAQSSIPKSGSQRDFVRVPKKKVSCGTPGSLAKLTAGAERVRVHAALLERIHQT